MLSVHCRHLVCIYGNFFIFAFIAWLLGFFPFVASNWFKVDVLNYKVRTLLWLGHRVLRGCYAKSTPSPLCHADARIPVHAHTLMILPSGNATMCARLTQRTFGPADSRVHVGYTAASRTLQIAASMSVIGLHLFLKKATYSN